MGLTYQFSKQYGVELYYMIQQSVQEVDPERSYILGVNFLMNLKFKHSESNDLPESSGGEGSN